MRERHSSYLSVLLFTSGIMLSLVSCSKGKDATPSKQDSTTTNATTHTRTYLALGDSYTIGQSIDSAGRYPAQAAGLLTAMGINIPAIRYIATTGWTTLDLQHAIVNANLATTFDVVSLLIGVNDQYQGVDTGTYAVRFRQVLQTSVMLAGNTKAHVVVISIPDYGVTPFGRGNAAISAQIDEFNAINKRITDSSGILYVNVTNMSRAAATDNSLLASDGLHYSPKEYLLWADSVVPLIYPMLK